LEMGVGGGAKRPLASHRPHAMNKTTAPAQAQGDILRPRRAAGLRLAAGFLVLRAEEGDTAYWEAIRGLDLAGLPATFSNTCQAFSKSSALVSWLSFSSRFLGK